MASETRFIYNNIIVVFVNPSFKNSNIVFIIKLVLKRKIQSHPNPAKL